MTKMIKIIKKDKGKRTKGKGQRAKDKGKKKEERRKWAKRAAREKLNKRPTQHTTRSYHPHTTTP
jgi:hypothetical protein